MDVQPKNQVTTGNIPHLIDNLIVARVRGNQLIDPIRKGVGSGGNATCKFCLSARSRIIFTQVGNLLPCFPDVVTDHLYLPPPLPGAFPP